MVSLQLCVAIGALFLHAFSFSFNYILVVIAKRNKGQMITNRYILHMAFAEVCLNLTQILCIDVTLWIGWENYGFVLHTAVIYVLVTANQIFFLFRYYLLVLIVLHRGIFIISPKISHYFETHIITYFILGCWLYVILINVMYFPLDCIRYYEAASHKWMTTCANDDLLPLVILRTISSFAFSYIPHFTVAVNLLIIVYLKYYRYSRNVLSNKRKISANFEFNMIIQPLMLACVLAVEPICFFIAGVAKSIADIPPLSPDASRVFEYAMTYLSTLTNFLYYFACHRDIRLLMWNFVRRKNERRFHLKTISRSVTTEPLTRVN